MIKITPPTTKKVASKMGQPEKNSYDDIFGDRRQSRYAADEGLNQAIGNLKEAIDYENIFADEDEAQAKPKVGDGLRALHANVENEIIARHGKAIPHDAQVCPNCGSANLSMPDHKFCLDCGRPVHTIISHYDYQETMRRAEERARNRVKAHTGVKPPKRVLSKNIVAPTHADTARMCISEALDHMGLKWVMRESMLQSEQLDETTIERIQAVVALKLKGHEI